MTTTGGVALPRGPLLERASWRGDSRLDGPQGVLDLPQRCAVTSGRAALVQALRLLDLQPGHAVLAPSFHCPTLAAPVGRLQAHPVFFALGADGLPDLASVQAHQAQSGARVLVVSHHFGLALSLSPVRQWCDEHGVLPPEDCAHALWGMAGERPVGHRDDIATANITKFLPLAEGGLLGSAPTDDSGDAAAAAMLSRCDMGRGESRRPAFSELLRQWLPQAEAARTRLRHSRAAPSIWPARPDDRAEAAPTGARALWAEDCGRAVPYVFPVWADDPGPVYQRLRREGHAVLHWDRRWPGAPADGTPGDADDIGGAIERYADLECRGWKGRVGPALAPGAALTAFYRGLLEKLSGQGRARVVELWLGERSAGSRLAVIGGDLVVMFKTTYAEDLDRLAPGQRLMRPTGYIGSSGRACQAVTSDITASVTELMNSGLTYVPYCSARRAWISRMVMPRAYMATILSSKPVKRHSRLGMSSGSKKPSRSQGNLDAHRTVLGQHCLAGATVSVVARVLGLGRTRREAQVVRQLCSQQALDQRLLEGLRGGLHRLGCHPHALIRRRPALIPSRVFARPMIPTAHPHRCHRRGDCTVPRVLPPPRLVWGRRHPGASGRPAQDGGSIVGRPAPLLLGARPRAARHRRDDARTAAGACDRRRDRGLRTHHPPQHEGLRAAAGNRSAHGRGAGPERTRRQRAGGVPESRAIKSDYWPAYLREAKLLVHSQLPLKQARAVLIQGRQAAPGQPDHEQRPREIKAVPPLAARRAAGRQP